jgi:transcription initiation factor TFIIH subunit 1
VRSAFAELKNGCVGWETRFSQVMLAFLAIHIYDAGSNNFLQLRIDKRAGEAALASMSQNVSARLDTRSRKGAPYSSGGSFAQTHLLLCIADFPPAFLRQLTTCQTAANEFLRQFWTALYPPPATTASSATPMQNAAKAAKMAGYLSKTREKVEALVRAGQVDNIDPERVKVVRSFPPLLSCWNDHG